MGLICCGLPSRGPECTTTLEGRKAEDGGWKSGRTTGRWLRPVAARPPRWGGGMRDNNTSGSGTPGQFGLVPHGEPEHTGSGFQKPPIYTSVQMLKTRPKTCHFLPLFAARCGHRARKPRAASPIDTRGSELAYAWSNDARKKWQIRAAKWHNSTPLSFTMFRERAEAGNQGGVSVRVRVRAGLRLTNFARHISRADDANQGGGRE